MLYQDKNWLITTGIWTSRAIAWTVGSALLATLALTFVVRPIYKAQAVLTLDADLSASLGNMELSFPATTSGNYIRYEFFATDALHRMTLPSLVADVATKLDIKAGGKAVKPEKVINPSLGDLLTATGGQGFGVKWVSDTQQFTVTGLSRNPDKAVEFADSYAAAILAANRDQHLAALRTLIERLDVQIAQTTSALGDNDRSLQALRAKAGSSDPGTELELANSRISTLEIDLQELDAQEAAHPHTLAHLLTKETEYGELRTTSLSLQANPLVLHMRKELEAQTANLAKTLSEFTPLHPDARATEAQIEQIKKRMGDEVARTFSEEINTLPSILDTVREQLLDTITDHLVYPSVSAQIKAKIDAEKRGALQLADAAAQAVQLTAQRTALLSSLTDAQDLRRNVEAIAARGLPTMRLASSAYINKANLRHYKHFPRRKNLLLRVGVFGLALAGLFWFGLDLSSGAIRRAWQAEECCPGLLCVELPLRLCHEPPGPAHARALLPAWSAVAGEHVVRLLSSSRGERELAAVATLANLYHARGESVLVLDGRGTARGPSHLDGTPGLAGVLRGDVPLPDAVVAHPAFPGGFVPCGPPGDPALAAASGSAVRQLVDQARATAQHVLLIEEGGAAAPPLLAHLAQPVSALLLLDVEEATSSQLERAAKEAGANLRAAVLCGVPVPGNLARLGTWREWFAHAATPPFAGFSRSG